jgi:hypothetical protein
MLLFEFCSLLFFAENIEEFSSFASETLFGKIMFFSLFFFLLIYKDSFLRAH